jgi:hypothetical protein
MVHAQRRNRAEQDKEENNQDRSAKAYPMVVSTVGEMHEQTKLYIEVLYAHPTATGFFEMLAKNDNAFAQGVHGGLDIPTEMLANKETAFEQIRTLPEFRCQDGPAGPGVTVVVIIFF